MPFDTKHMKHPTHRTPADRAASLTKRLKNVEAAITAQRERMASLSESQKLAAMNNLGSLLASRDMLLDKMNTLAA